MGVKKLKNGPANQFFKRVCIENTEPHQIPTSIGFLKSADTYQQRFIKHPHVISVFHSYAELLHAALLEADSDVTSFIPQPFRARVGNRRYVPDCYYIKSNERIVVELKPRGEFKDELKIPLENKFAILGLKFIVVSNEEILEQEQLALNWLHIIRTLCSAELEDSCIEEEKIVRHLESCTKDNFLGDVISAGSRISERNNEIALFRLAHRGIVRLKLDREPINLRTNVSCA